jgi:hypothetical protein
MMPAILLVVVLIFSIGGDLTSSEAEKARRKEAMLKQVETCVDTEADNCVDMLGS